MLPSGEIPDPRDIMIIGFADACGLWRGLIDEPARVKPEPKLKQLAKKDLIDQAVARAADRARAA